MNPGYSYHPPVEGNKSVPEGWKIRSDKNKLQEHHINKSNSTLVAKIETEREFRDPGWKIRQDKSKEHPSVKSNESVPKGWKIRQDKSKEQETLSDHQDMILTYNHKAPDKVSQLKHTRGKHKISNESVPEGQKLGQETGPP